MCVVWCIYLACRSSHYVVCYYVNLHLHHTTIEQIFQKFMLVSLIKYKIFFPFLLILCTKPRLRVFTYEYVVYALVIAKHLICLPVSYDASLNPYNAGFIPATSNSWQINCNDRASRSRLNSWGSMLQANGVNCTLVVGQTFLVHKKYTIL